jgi:hypothetical protein
MMKKHGCTIYTRSMGLRVFCVKTKTKKEKERKNDRTIF